MTKLIKGADLNIVIGKPAIVYMLDGSVLRTTPVKSYFVGGGNIIIETQNSTYSTQ